MPLEHRTCRRRRLGRLRHRHVETLLRCACRRLARRLHCGGFQRAVVSSKVHDRLTPFASSQTTSRQNTECDSAHGWVASSLVPFGNNARFGFGRSLDLTLCVPRDAAGILCRPCVLPHLTYTVPFLLEPVLSKACRYRLAPQSAVAYLLALRASRIACG